MSLFTDASLVYVPSGVKDGKTYSIKPTDGSGDLTFSRGSDIEATRVGGDGLIHKAQVNLLLQSNSFDTSWISDTLSVTGGQSGYDGTNDAWLLNSSGGFIYQTVSLSASVFTYSVYAKAGTADGIRLRFDEAAPVSDSNAIVNLSTGAEISSDGIDLDIQNVGGGWYRISFTHNATNLANVRFYVTDDTGVSTTGTIYIQDAQLNYGLVAQTYQETTTAAVVSGITDDMPRLSYDPANPTCPSLLLEPSRSNIIADSEFFNNTAVWTQNPQITIDDNQDTSPEGVVNASRIYNNTGSETTIFYGASVNVGSAGTYTFSIFAKKGGLGWIRLRCLGFDAAANNNCYFDLENGVKGTNTFDEANIEDYGNGWFRISVTFTTSTDLTGTCYVYAADGDNDTTVASGASYYLSVYGAQLEAGSYPTSYIPTYGSSATRTEDACSKTGISSLIGTEGSIFVDFDLLQLDGFGGIVDLATSPPASSTRILLWENAGNQLQANFGTFGTAISLNSVTIGRHKALITYSASAFKFFVDGVKIGQTTPSTAPTGLSELTFVCSAGGVDFQKKNIHQTLLFTSALSDADAITLTTL